MPKISEAGGPSHEGVLPAHDADLREGEDGARVERQAGIAPQERTGEHGEFHATRNATEEPVTPEEEADRYADWSKDDLAAEAERRGLPKSGNKDELRARLEADDQPQPGAENED